MKQKIIDGIIFAVICLSLMANVVLGLFVINNHTITSHLYAMDAKVVSADGATKTVTFEDRRGHYWQIDELEDWIDGDDCIIIFNTWGTDESIEDDKIVKITAK